MGLSEIKVFIINTLLGLATLLPQSTLSIGIVDQPKSFLPHEARSDGERIVSQLVFRSLFKYKEGKLIDDLVNTWSVSDDKKIYKIKLLDNARWQDGSAITSNDILYTLTLYNNLINEMEIEKISEREVQIKLSTPTTMLPSVLTFGLEPSHLREQAKLTPVGSTSYRILRIQKDGPITQGITIQSFKENKQYNRINVLFYNTENDLQTAYKLGEITAFLSNIDMNIPHVNKHSLTFLGRYFTFIFNTKQPVLEPIENRKVLEETLDINSLLKGNYYANSAKTQGPIGYSSVTKKSLFESSYNPEVQLTSVQKNVMTKLSILLPNNSDGRQIETLLQESWKKKLGIELEIEFLDLNQIAKRGTGGEFDVLLIGHEVTPDPDRYIFWHSTQIGKLNLSRFEDLRADKSLEEGRKSTTDEERLKHYSIFQDVIATKVPAVFLYHPGSYFYVSEKTPVPLPKEIYYPSDILKNL